MCGVGEDMREQGGVTSVFRTINIKMKWKQSNGEEKRDYGEETSEISL